MVPGKQWSDCEQDTSIEDFIDPASAQILAVMEASEPAAVAPMTLSEDAAGPTEESNSQDDTFPIEEWNSFEKEMYSDFEDIKIKRHYQDSEIGTNSGVFFEEQVQNLDIYTAEYPRPPPGKLTQEQKQKMVHKIILHSNINYSPPKFVPADHNRKASRPITFVERMNMTRVKNQEFQDQVRSLAREVVPEDVVMEDQLQEDMAQGDMIQQDIAQEDLQNTEGRPNQKQQKNKARTVAEIAEENERKLRMLYDSALRSCLPQPVAGGKLTRIWSSQYSQPEGLVQPWDNIPGGAISENWHWHVVKHTTNCLIFSLLAHLPNKKERDLMNNRMVPTIRTYLKRWISDKATDEEIRTAWAEVQF
jgi:hypothetical protein